MIGLTPQLDGLIEKIELVTEKERPEGDFDYVLDFSSGAVYENSAGNGNDGRKSSRTSSRIVRRVWEVTLRMVRRPGRSCLNSTLRRPRMAKMEWMVTWIDGTQLRRASFETWRWERVKQLCQMSTNMFSGRMRM